MFHFFALRPPDRDRRLGQNRVAQAISDKHDKWEHPVLLGEAPLCSLAPVDLRGRRELASR